MAWHVPTQNSFVFIMNQRFVRRVKGKVAARKVFSESYPLRASGKLGWQVRHDSANMCLSSLLWLSVCST